MSTVNPISGIRRADYRAVEAEEPRAAGKLSVNDGQAKGKLALVVDTVASNKGGFHNATDFAIKEIASMKLTKNKIECIAALYGLVEKNDVYAPAVWFIKQNCFANQKDLSKIREKMSDFQWVTLANATTAEVFKAAIKPTKGESKVALLKHALTTPYKSYHALESIMALKPSKAQMLQAQAETGLTFGEVYPLERKWLESKMK